MVKKHRGNVDSKAKHSTALIEEGKKYTQMQTKRINVRGRRM